MGDTRQHGVVVHVRELAEHARRRNQGDTQPQVLRGGAHEEARRHRTDQQYGVHAEPEDTAAGLIVTLTGDRRQNRNEETGDGQTQRQRRRGLFGGAEVATGQVHGEDEGRHNRVEARRTNIPHDPGRDRTAAVRVVNDPTLSLRFTAGRRNSHSCAFGCRGGASA